jgi:tetratricopeptide (TPR) repeat protein
LQEFEKALQTDPDFCIAYAWLGQMHREQGKLDEAIRVLQAPQVQAIECSGTWGMSELAYWYAVAGKREEAEKLLDEILEYSKQKFVTSNYIAVVYLGLGDKDQALCWLEKGLREESLWVGDLLRHLPTLRADPKFADFLRRINLQ